MATAPSASYSVIFRLRLPGGQVQLDGVVAAIAEAGGEVVISNFAEETTLPEPLATVVVNTSSLQHEKAIAAAVRALPGVVVEKITDRTFALHDGGKMVVESKTPGTVLAHPESPFPLAVFGATLKSFP